MGTEAIVSLVLTYGIPFTEYLITTLQTKGMPTSDDWKNLRLLANASAKSEMTDRLKAANIDPASAQGLALLALVS